MDPFLDEPQAEEGGFDPRALIRMFWRRKWLFIIPFILCFSMATVAIRTMTPVYYSAGQVQIVLRNTDTRLLEDPSRQFGRQDRDVDRRAYAEMDLLLTSPEFLEGVVRDLQLYVDPTWVGVPGEGRSLTEAQAIARAVKRLEKSLRLEIAGSRVFSIGVRDFNPQRAHNLATYVLNKFIEDYRANQVAFRTSTRNFLEGQLQEYQAELTKAEGELNEFMAGMASVTLSDIVVNSGNLGNVEENLGQLKTRYNGPDLTEYSRLEQEIRSLVGSNFNVSRYLTDPNLGAIVREMQDLALDQAVLTAGSPGYSELQNRLGLLRVRLNSQIEQLVAPDYPNLGYMDRNQVSQFVYFSIFRTGVKWVIDNLDRQVRDFRNFTTQQPAQSARLAELQDRVFRARELVQTIQQEVTQQTMNLEASQSEIGFQVKVRKKAAYPLFPIEPNKIKLLMMGFVLSLGLGGGLVVLAIFLDRSFSAVEDIERALGVAVIGTLPLIVDDHFERKKKLRLLRWVTIILGIIAVSAIGFLVIYPRLS
jgi:succinoglycan biosynthesis transport protein ExoP